MHLIMKNLKKICSLFVILALTLSMGNIPASAAAPDDEASPAMTVFALNGEYTVVASGAAATNRSVTIICYNDASVHHNDVRMRDINGNVLWEEYGAIPHSGSRTFICGSDVYYVEVRIAATNIFDDLFVQKSGFCNVTYN
ncbi:MAG: hypothetical protein Q4B29_00830 [Candidatus Saccharibacteria bacterium]|nr:hypothetical protein [Candidatus Saccharibacteria bacterium]